MRATKFAISVPAETMSHVDRAAKRLGMTRSRYISVVLARVAQRERDAAVSRRVPRLGTLTAARLAEVWAGVRLVCERDDPQK